MVFEAKLTILWLCFVNLIQSSATSSSVQSWEELFSLPASSLKSPTVEVYIEISLYEELDLTGIKSLTKNLNNMPRSGIQKEVRSCKPLKHSFPLNSISKIYVVPSYETLEYTLIECMDDPNLNLLSVNPKKFLNLNNQEQNALILNSIQGEIKSVKIFFGSLCGDNEKFMIQTLECRGKIRKLTESGYYQAKRDGKVLEALLNYTLSEVSGDEKLVMIRDIRDYIDENTFNETTFDDITGIILNLIELSELTDDEFNTLFTYLYKDWSKTDGFAVSDTAILNILNQAAFYLDHFNFSVSSLLTVDEILPTIFQKYSQITTSSSSILKKSSKGSKILEIVQYLFQGGQITNDGLSSISISLENQSIFNGSEYGNCILIYSESSFNSIEQIFSFHLYEGVSSTEIEISSRIFHYSITLQNLTYHNEYSVLCEIHKCKAVSGDNSDIVLFAASNGVFKVTEKFCDDSTDIQDYLNFGDLSSAIVFYLLDSEASECLLIYMWNDLKEYFRTGLADYNSFKSMIETSLLFIEPSTHYANLNDGIVCDIFGEAWLTGDLIPDIMDSSFMETTLTLASSYIYYFNQSILSIENSDNEISRFLTYYSNLSLELGQDPLNSTSYLEDVTVKIIKTKMTKQEFNAGTADYGSLFDVEISGNWPLGEYDILAVLFVKYINTNLVTDIVGFHLYYSGYTEKNGTSRIYEFMDEEFTSDEVNLTTTVKINKGSDFECLDSECAFNNLSPTEINYDVSVQGVTFIIEKCNGKQEYDYDDNVCLNDCDGTCNTCDENNTCLDCIENFTFVDGKCYYNIMMNCSIPSSDQICGECESGLGLENDFSGCKECTDQNVFLSENSTCACVNNSSLIGNECVCDETYGVNNNICIKCEDTNCLDCKSNNTVCTECMELFELLDNNTCVCVANSSLIGSECVCMNTYGENNNSCVECHDSNCFNCSDDYLVCNECKEFFELDEKNTCACVNNSSPYGSDCACDNTYGVSNSSSCIQCEDSNCLKCTDNYTDCTECKELFEFSESNECVCVGNSSLIDTQCVCNNTFGANKNSCVKCQDANCHNCAENYTVCSECRDFFELSDKNSCICVGNSSIVGSDCICDIYYGASNSSCVKCEDSNCFNCSSNYSVCFECEEFFELDQNNICVCVNNSSPKGDDCVCNDKFGVSDNNCIECEVTNCFKCTDNSTVCTECMELFELLDNNTCVCVANSSLIGSKCVCMNTYGENNNSCVECQDSNCFNCSNNFSVCNECREFFELNENNTCACVNNSSPKGDDCVCDINYGISNNSCIECEVSNCLKCTDNNTVCTECMELFELLDNNTCVCVANSSLIGLECVCGSTYGIYNNSCVDCKDSNCLNCSDDYSICYECKELFELNENNTCACVNNSSPKGDDCVCDINYGISNNSCLECEVSNCFKCTDDNTVCTECEDLFELLENNTCTCVGNSSLIGLECVCGSTYGIYNNSCVDCKDSNCLNCSDDYSICYECKELFELNENNTCACINNSSPLENDCACNDNYGVSNNSCIECEVSKCFKCTDNSKVCTECELLFELLENNTCVCTGNSSLNGSDCVCNTNYGASNNICIECEDKNCLNCSKNYSTCFECEDLYEFSDSQTCVCIDEYGAVNDTCAKCIDSYCLNCSNNYSECNECKELFEFSINNACVCVGNSSLIGSNCVCDKTYGEVKNSCIKCTDSKCLNCSNNYLECSECFPRYYLNSTCTKCKETCKTCKNSTHCESCVENAVKKSNTCECIQNSHYSSVSDSCECDSGYNLTSISGENACVNCFAYLTQEDILIANYSSDFVYFYIYFNIKIQKITKCSEVAIDPSVFGENAQCSQSSDTLIKVKLGSNWTPLTSTLELNKNKLLEKNTDTCISLPESSLLVNISLDSLDYFTSGSFIGRTDIYLGCTSSGTTDYKVTGLNDRTGLGLTANWSASSENSTIELDLISQLEGIDGSIAYLDFSTSNFSVFSGNATLIYTVTNKFNVSESINLNVFFIQSKLITIEINGGNEFNVYSSQKLWFTGYVVDNCGQTSNIKFDWKFIDVPDGPDEPDFTSYNGLMLYNYALQPNSTYLFNFSASGGSIDSNVVQLTINTEIEDIVVLLNSPVSFSLQDEIFSINANDSYDPNYKENTELSYKWTCIEGSKACSSELKSIFKIETSSILSFNSTYLEDYDNIIIKVSVSSVLASNSDTVTVKISKNIPTLTLLIPTERLSMSKYHFISGSSSASRQELAYIWDIESIDSNKYLSKFLFLFIYANAFEKGGEYSITLKATTTATESSESPEYAEITSKLKINNPPVCSYISISPETGQAFYDQFIVYSECTDEEEDYPLYSKVVYFNNDSKYQRKNVLKFGNAFERTTTKLPSGNLTLLYNVCDSYDDCDELSINVIVSKRKNSRSLADQAYESEYRESVSIDPNLKPGLCIVLSNSYDLSDSFWEEVREDLIEYIDSFSSYDTFVLNSVAGCLSGLVSSAQTDLTIENYISVYNLSISTLEKYKDYLDNSEVLANFDSDSLEYFLDIAESFISLAEDTELGMSINQMSNFAIQYQVLALRKQFYKKASGYEYTFDRTELSSYRGIVDVASKSSVSYKDVVFDVTSLNLSTTQQLGLFISIFSDLGNFSLYSDGFEIRLSNDGQIINENFIFPETLEYYTVFDQPILVNVPTKEQLSLDYRCGTLLENDIVNFTGCEIVEVGTNNVTLSISHTSLFVIVEPQLLTSIDESCEVNYAPVSIMAVVGFITVILIPIMILLDNNETLKEEENLNSDQGVSKTVEYSPHSPSSYTERPLNSISDMSIPDPEEISESIIENPNAADYTIEFKLRSIDQPEKKAKKAKSCFTKMIEGHLLFGIYVYRPIFARILRILVLGSTLILQLFLIGIFLYYKYETDDGEYDNTDEVSTQTLFDDYKDTYFGFCIVAVAIAIPYEVLLIFMFSQNWNKAALRTVGVIFLIIVTGGSIAGIIILSLDFCFKWSGYWAISFLWSILIEIFCLQFIYMLVRYPLRKEKI